MTVAENVKINPNFHLLVLQLWLQGVIICRKLNAVPLETGVICVVSCVAAMDCGLLLRSNHYNHILCLFFGF